MDDATSLKNYVHEVPDFPIAGVLFRDISPLLAVPAALDRALAMMVKGVDLGAVDHVVGVESRGFILGAALAQKHQKGFIPMRKAGKLPPPVETIHYKLEYGEAVLEMRAAHGRVVLVDDVLATGGTLRAAHALCERCGLEVVDIAVLIDLTSLHQFRFAGRQVRSALQY